MMQVVVYARTSGDEEDTGQDVQAQAALVKRRLGDAGHEVIATFTDDGVSGSTSPFSRDGFKEALRTATANGAAVAFREISRFSRRHPVDALQNFDLLWPVPVICLTEDHFTTAGRPNEENPSLVLLRFVSLWQAWSELVGTRVKTQAAMDAITSGNRPTKSGKPPGRPERVIPPAALQLAKDALAADKPFAEALRLVNAELVGDAVDPATVKKRSVGKGTLARALGLWSESAQNPNPPKTPSAQKAEVSGVIGPVVGDGQ